MVCSNGWRCRACPVAKGSFCSSGKVGSEERQKCCFCKPGATLVPGRHFVIAMLVCVVLGPHAPGRWQIALLSCRRTPHPSGLRRRMDEGSRSPGLGWNEHRCVISALLLLLPPYILSTSIKSNRILAACHVISCGCVCCALGSHAACILWSELLIQLLGLQ